jgi:hypothetical protein
MIATTPGARHPAGALARKAQRIEPYYLPPLERGPEDSGPALDGVERSERLVEERLGRDLANLVLDQGHHFLPPGEHLPGHASQAGDAVGEGGVAPGFLCSPCPGHPRR